MVMAGSDAQYQVVYRGQSMPYYRQGMWVFFQRPKACGGGYWLGKTFDGYFQFGLERPVSLYEGLLFLQQASAVEAAWDTFDDDFQLAP